MYIMQEWNRCTEETLVLEETARLLALFVVVYGVTYTLKYFFVCADFRSEEEHKALKTHN